MMTLRTRVYSLGLLMWALAWCRMTCNGATAPGTQADTSKTGLPGGESVEVLAQEGKLLPLVLDQSIAAHLNAAPVQTQAWAVRSLFHPPPSGNYLTNALNVAWSNTFSFRRCRGVTAIPSGVWSGANPTVRENTQCRGVLVSPRHILNVSHCGYWERQTFGPGNYVRFIGTNNQVHLIEPLAKVQLAIPGNGYTGTNGPFPHVEVILLAEDVPGDVQPVRFWPTNVTDYTTTPSTHYQWRTFTVCQHNVALPQAGYHYVPWSGTTAQPLYTESTTPNWHDSGHPTNYVHGGDSGSPTFSVFGGELVCESYLNRMHRDLINGAMHYIWTNNGLPSETCYQLQVVELSGYRKLR